MNAAPPLPRMAVLVVEDNPSVASLLQRGLERDGYAVDVAVDGNEALTLGLENTYVAIVLDVMIPEPDGLAVARQLRQHGSWVPILMLTARDRIEDRIAGLYAGADDYLGKPFSVRELTARLHALSRRASFDRPNVLQAGDIQLDPATREARLGTVAVPLSTREFDLLAELVRHPGEVMADTYLADHVFGRLGQPGRDVVAFYIDRLRDKLDRPFGRDVIQRVEETGYRLAPTR
jgi:two-component system OmpR family response regulator